MSEPSAANTGSDPAVPDWPSVSLPDAWPDELDFRKPTDLWRLLSQVFGNSRSKVELPQGLPGRDRIPKYVLQEFHRIPNGNYSRRITRGYITGFDRSMLGSLTRSRAETAERMKHLRSVLDVGCGGGSMAVALRDAGVEDVWGLDPSPYLLWHAAHDHAGIKFVQGIAEDTGFPNERFDGIAICFLLHEVPARHLDRALREFNRILRPGGLLAAAEPSPLQLRGSLGSLVKRWGWRGLYYRGLARFVHEPFIEAWHDQDLNAKFAEFGFELLEDRDELPIRQLLARKTAG